MGYWEVAASDIFLGGNATNLCAGCRVVIDTGFAQLLGPPHIINKLTATINLREDCSNYDNLPTLGFGIAGKVLSLPPAQYVDTSEGSCTLSLMAREFPPPSNTMIILGIPFLTQYYTAFDLRNEYIGFAESKRPNDPNKMPTILASIPQKS